MILLRAKVKTAAEGESSDGAAGPTAASGKEATSTGASTNESDKTGQDAGTQDPKDGNAIKKDANEGKEGNDETAGDNTNEKTILEPITHCYVDCMWFLSAPVVKSITFYYDDKVVHTMKAT